MWIFQHPKDMTQRQREIDDKIGKTAAIFSGIWMIWAYFFLYLAGVCTIDFIIYIAALIFCSTVIVAVAFILLKNLIRIIRK